ncbi:MAG: hypothetical protein AAGD09_26845, partial [Cyanobacteria bacterium P01_F01_bin.56]
MEASRADRDEKVENRFPILTAYKIFKAIDREQNIFMTVPLWLDVIVKLTPAFITLIVGSFGSWIAFSQYQTNKDKLRLDLFEKRLEAYEKVQEYFRHLVREASVTDEAFSLLAEARYSPSRPGKVHLILLELLQKTEMKAYSIDFRRKIIKAYEDESISQRQLAKRFG